MARTPRQPTSRIITRESARNIRPGQFVKEIISELQKVSWPGRDEVLRLTGIVLLISLAVGFALGVLDMGFSRFLNVLVFRG